MLQACVLKEITIDQTLHSVYLAGTPITQDVQIVQRKLLVRDVLLWKAVYGVKVLTRVWL